MLHSRREAREAALQALYGCDQILDWSREAVFDFFRIHQADALDDEHLSFCRTLITGVIEHKNELDTLIQEACDNWKVSGMPRIDLNILRIAVYELQFIKDIPHQVSINEAIEVAKRFCNDESPKFINGVLDTITGRLLSKKES